MDWRSDRVPDSGSTGCEFKSHHCFSSLAAWASCLPQMCTLPTQEMNGIYPSALEIIVVTAWGVFSPGSQVGYGMFRPVIKARGLNIVKS